MTAAGELRAEFADTLEAYFEGRLSLSDYLGWEVLFTLEPNRTINPAVTMDAASLSLLGQEFLMDLRPLEEFEAEGRAVLAKIRTQPAAEAAGG